MVCKEICGDRAQCERDRLNNKKVIRALKKQIARHESKKPRTHVYAERIVYFFDVIEHNTPLGCIPHCLHKCAHIPCLRVEVIVAERGESAKNNDVERDYCNFSPRVRIATCVAFIWGRNDR